MEKDISEIISTNPAVTLGILLSVLALIFYSTDLKQFKNFYKIVPALLLCYFIPAILSYFGIISDNTIDIGLGKTLLSNAGFDVSDIAGVSDFKDYVVQNEIDKSLYEKAIKSGSLWYISSRFLLPASLFLLTLNIDLKGVFGLGPKALIMFFTATIGVIIGGPIAVMIFKAFSPETLSDIDNTPIWAGLSTVAGSWIGGGANQTAMKENFEVGETMYGIMAVIDVVVAEVWMMFLLLGVAKHKAIDRRFKADASSVDRLLDKMKSYTESITRVPSFKDLMIILGLAFGVVGVGHLFSGEISSWVSENAKILIDFGMASSFFWLIIIATTAGVILSFTKARSYEGAGASKIGTVFIYVLVAVIGMKMDLKEIFKYPELFLLGLIWMMIHVGLLFLVGYLIKAPYFFLAVGSKANIGGAASAPVVAGAFHASLAPVGVLLATLGYVVGTFGALLCANLMKLI